MWFVAIVVGIIAVLLGVFVLRRELNAAIRAIPTERRSEVTRRELDELNSSFFDIANDLEGKYSVHEKQIQDMEFILKGVTQRQVEKGFREQQKKPAATRSEKDREKRAAQPERGVEQTVRRQEVDDDVRIFERTSREKILAEEARNLIENGFTELEVARKLKISIGEVRLILKTK